MQFFFLIRFWAMMLENVWIIMWHLQSSSETSNKSLFRIVKAKVAQIVLTKLVTKYIIYDMFCNYNGKFHATYTNVSSSKKFKHWVYHLRRCLIKQLHNICPFVKTLMENKKKLKLSLLIWFWILFIVDVYKTRQEVEKWFLLIFFAFVICKSK